MQPSTWWAVSASLVLILAAAGVIWLTFGRGRPKQLTTFKILAISLSAVAAALVLFSFIPFPSDYARSKDVALSAGTFGPIVLTLSLTLVSIFFAVGEWYETFRKFRTLGISNAEPNRMGRQHERAQHWQGVLAGTKDRIVITGVTLGGWFVNGWEDTRINLLRILPQATVQVLLADPGTSAFTLRANDPAEVAEAAIAERARERARRVYERIADQILSDAQFANYVAEGRLSFYVYDSTPFSSVWSDDRVYFTPYLPGVSDSACPEFLIARAGLVGGTITNAIEQLIERATKVETPEQAKHLAAMCV